MTTHEDLRYPIGRFDHDGPVSDEDVERWIGEIAELPSRFRAVVEGLSDEQLDTRYRPGGWTLRQVAHHVPDSHLNAYVRCMWTLTEDEPTIKVYDEKRWSETELYRELPVAASLDFLEQLHHRWVTLLRTLSRDQLARRFVHPEWGEVELARALGMYAWHGRHHLAHITRTIGG